MSVLIRAVIGVVLALAWQPSTPTQLRNVTDAASAAADAVVDRIDAGAGPGTLVIFGSTCPATADLADSGTTLAVLTFSDPAFGSAVDGTATANAITADSSANASGTMLCFRAKDSNGNVVIQGSISGPGGGGELVMSTGSVTAGQSVSVSSLTYTQPTSMAGLIEAGSCSAADVQTAIDDASTGDTVSVPAGTCTWSTEVTLAKAITLRGAGAGVTTITLSTAASATKQAAGVTRVKDFTFTKTGGGATSKAWYIGGSWQSAEPVIFSDNTYVISDSGLFFVTVAGGVIISDSTFTGDWNDSFIQMKDYNDTSGSWSAADTIGTADTDGTQNLYIEDNTFTGGTNQGLDADDATRLVYRYNTLNTSSVNSHGWDTSAVGVRHWEIYNNTFTHPGGSCATSLCNQNWLILMRGGTGVITDNTFVNIAGSNWGDKPEINFWIRGAEDNRPQGACGNVSYPVPRQIGQNHNGTAYFTDPIRIWNNSGAQVIDANWKFGNPCGLTFSDFWQLNRDYYLSARPSYTKYTYPHPLR